MLITVDSVMALNPCETYTRERVTELIGLGPQPALESIPFADARWILVRLLTEQNLRKWACRCALSVAGLWDMPDVVRRYLETQDESLRAAAAAAAHAAYAAYAAAYAAAAYAAARKKMKLKILEYGMSLLNEH